MPRQRFIRRMTKRAATTVGGWGRKPVGSGRNPMQYTTRGGRTMSRSEIGSSGMRRMGAAGGFLGVSAMTRQSSGSKGRPPSHSSGGNMMM